MVFMGIVPKPQRLREFPLVSVPQGVPSRVCLTCEVCCRFPEIDSFLRPYFTETEIRAAIEHGVPETMFPHREGCQIKVVPHPTGEGYLCPAFDPTTFECRIYDVRPFDCQLYPFVIMWDSAHSTVVLGWDTKCPFLMAQVQDHSQVNASRNSESDRLLLSPELETVACAVAARLETPDVQDMLASHPALITRYQDDVVVLRVLNGLTHRCIRKEPPADSSRSR